VDLRTLGMFIVRIYFLPQIFFAIYATSMNAKCIKFYRNSIHILFTQIIIIVLYNNLHVSSIHYNN